MIKCVYIYTVYMLYINYYIVNCKYCNKLKYNMIPVVPHKAVAEVSKIGNLYIGEIGCCESGIAERSH